ncbi:DUF1573 domain-containing protein [Candidatus Woesearchaeota archaeon]|nr:DUF1573 domain-containing protein [Candidatus Woesearchaeota archaeon]
MRKELLIIFIVMFIGLVSGCTSQRGIPKIELSATSFDLGDINPDEGSRIEIFSVKNVGNAPLLITSVSTSCGCTEAEVHPDTVQPGEEATLTVTYDPSVHPGLVGEMERVVYIKSNDPLQKEVELELVGNSLPSANPVITQEKDHDEDAKMNFEISPFELNEKIHNKESFKLLDVREDFEYEENHLKDTSLLSVNKITQEELDKLGLKKDDEIVVYCRSGRRSAKAYELLTALGYSNVKSLQGGILHWMEEGYSVVRGMP